MAAFEPICCIASTLLTSLCRHLRDRRDDIPYLAEYLRQQFNIRFKKEAGPISRDVIQSLAHRDWPGNVRELENCIARYVILGTEEVFQAERVEKRPFHFTYEATEDGKIPLKRIAQQVSRRIEHDVILKVLQANQWNRRKTAETLKISYRALLVQSSPGRSAGQTSPQERREALLKFRWIRPRCSISLRIAQILPREIPTPWYLYC